ncbi:MAG: phage integrase N-terminal SAM-like domain-containing protein [Rhodospirillales bacterium]
MADTATSQLRQRMIEDRTLRGFSPGTQRGYIAAVRNFTDFLGRPPDQADGEDLRRYQLHMRSSEATAHLTQWHHAPEQFGGRGHLPRPWTWLAARQCRSCEPRPAEGDVSN